MASVGFFDPGNQGDISPTTTQWYLGGDGVDLIRFEVKRYHFVPRGEFEQPNIFDLSGRIGDR